MFKKDASAILLIKHFGRLYLVKSSSIKVCGSNYTAVGPLLFSQVLTTSKDKQESDINQDERLLDSLILLPFFLCMLKMAKNYSCGFFSSHLVCSIG